MIKLAKLIPIPEVSDFQDFKCTPKKHIKISNGRLPADFFSHRQKKKTKSSLSSARNQDKRRQNSRQIYQRDPLKIKYMNRENKTAEVGNSEEDLIQGIISTTREMKRVFRKHSMELRKENASKKADLCLQLPPLVMRKGVTTPF